MQFTADHVWALAVIADRINEGYVNEAVWGYSDAGESKLLKEANKVMVKKWLRENTVTPTEADIEQGRTVRHYFNGFLLKELSGKINDFERQALKIAQMDEFTGRNMLEFAIISCLPNTMRNDQNRNDTARAIRESTQLVGAVGDVVQGEFEVIRCYYNQNYNKYRITAKLVDSFVDFWYNKNMEQGALVKLKGKIKSVRSDNTTQLNYVKQVG